MRSKLLVGILSLAVWGSAASVWADGGGKSFSNKDIKGTYAEKSSGFVAGAGNPFPTDTSLPQSETGLEVANGKGNFTASIVFSIGGSICSGTVTGTYQVNPNGTGTSTGIFTPTSPTSSTCKTGNQNEAFTIVTSRKVDFISTDSDLVASGTAERQAHDNGND